MITLESKLTIDELCRWKFHWAICKIDEAIKHNPCGTSLRRQSDKVTMADVQKAIDEVQIVTRDMNRFLWEINTMTGNDYEVNLHKLLESNDKYQQWLTKLKFFNETILQMTDEAQSDIRINIEHQLEKLNDRYYY